jgi:hypothetical protein
MQERLITIGQSLWKHLICSLKWAETSDFKLA